MGNKHQAWFIEVLFKCICVSAALWHCCGSLTSYSSSVHPQRQRCKNVASHWEPMTRPADGPRAGLEEANCLSLFILQNNRACAAVSIWCGGIWIQVRSKSVCVRRTAFNRKEANGQHCAIFIEISVPVASHDLCNHVCSFSLYTVSWKRFTTISVLLLKIMRRF